MWTILLRSSGNNCPSPLWDRSDESHEGKEETHWEGKQWCKVATICHREWPWHLGTLIRFINWNTCICLLAQYVFVFCVDKYLSIRVTPGKLDRIKNLENLDCLLPNMYLSLVLKGICQQQWPWHLGGLIAFTTWNTNLALLWLFLVWDTNIAVTLQEFCLS